MLYNYFCRLDNIAGLLATFLTNTVITQVGYIKGRLVGGGWGEWWRRVGGQRQVIPFVRTVWTSYELKQC